MARLLEEAREPAVAARAEEAIEGAAIALDREVALLPRGGVEVKRGRVMPTPVEERRRRNLGDGSVPIAGNVWQCSPLRRNGHGGAVFNGHRLAMVDTAPPARAGAARFQARFLESARKTQSDSSLGNRARLSSRRGAR